MKLQLKHSFAPAELVPTSSFSQGTNQDDRKPLRGVIVKTRNTLFALSTFVLISASAPVPVQSSVVATELNRPQGVLVAEDGSLYVSDDGTGGTVPFTAPAMGGGTEQGTQGETARVVKVAPDGTQSVVTNMLSVNLPSLGPTGGGKLAMIGSDVYVANGIWNAGYSTPRPLGAAAVLKIEGTTTTEVADLFTFEVANNPDGVPAAEGGIDSHAYGLTAGTDGQLYVADAGANALLRVDPATGTVSLVAALQGRTGTGVQSVPTGVAFGADGAIYVSLLSGYPFTPGAARVVRVAEGTASDFATDLTLLTDLELGPDGKLYAVSLGQSDAAAQPPYLPGTGTVVRLGAGGEKETVLSGLGYPTAIAFNAQGDAYVTENGLGVGTPGTGRVIKYAQLTQYAPQ